MVERAVAALEGARILRLYPPPQADLPATEVYTDLSFPDRLEDPLPYVLVNMVASVDGRAATGGKASGIGSAADRLLMDSLRAKADAVMIGAGTLRAEGLTLGVSPRASSRRRESGLSPQPLAVVIAGSRDLSRTIDENLLSSKPDNTLLIVHRGYPERLKRALRDRARIICAPADPHTADNTSVDLRSALLTLRREFGVRRLLVEGGPRINGRLVSDGLASELFLTLAPKLLGTAGRVAPDGGATSVIEGARESGPATELRLLSSYLFDSELYLRYALPGHLTTEGDRWP